MTRPYVICHMLPSVDGRIVLRDWGVENATREYEKTAATFGADAWGGGKINGSFLAADLIDELSVLVGPVADGSTGTATLFDAGRSPARRLKLLSVEKRAGGIVWLRYKVRR